VASACARAAGIETASQGLKLRITSGQSTDARPARLIALTVPGDTPASPFIPPGPFKATWEGFVTLRIRGSYTFLPYGSGTVRIFVDDKQVMSATGADLASSKSDAVKLSKGKNKIRVEYESPAKGDAIFRLFWKERGLGHVEEPLPPTMLSYDAGDADLKSHWSAHQGRALFGELRCIRCHGDGDLGASAMPELSQDAPDLSNIGARLKEHWMAAWIDNPRALNPRAEMPKMFADRQSAADVAAYLLTLGGPMKDEPAPAWTAEQTAAGARIYTNLGCIACHTPADFAGKDTVTPPRIPHDRLAEKYSIASLRDFLKDPSAHFKWIRMPNFHLSTGETYALISYLYRKPAQPLAEFPKGDPVRGKQLFTTVGCLNCHAASGVSNQAKMKSLAEIPRADWNSGCLAASADQRRGAPDFGLTEDERSELQSFAKAGFDSLKRDDAIEFAERQMAVLDCAACHERDGREDTWTNLRDEIDAIVAKLPPEQTGGEPFSAEQSRPPLTWVGEKLRPQWMVNFIAGRIDYKPRPWLRGRMPSFAARADGIARGLAMEHGFPPVAPPEPKPDAKLAEIGRKLVSKDGGFSCVMCHSIGEQKAIAPFDSPAPNFDHVSERLTHEYFDRWMLNPQRLLPGTRMPTFAPDGTTALKAYFNGDAHQQFNAIWNYMLEGQDIQPPG
jgi:mono/diheme cytochrome c family protein